MPRSIEDFINGETLRTIKGLPLPPFPWEQR